ncbi:spore germination protein [Desmospora activa]|uniref:Spore germination protein KA n=1 Tax=Desmospora activa DSM 45169 TaxID=1121389 RepID=A0A2T4Z6Q8_9BACL|nr:spore germination protein [Desmospora activa]PTM57574.1 spore germination protein KA [Desmospora activa DSM 45169]
MRSNGRRERRRKRRNHRQQDSVHSNQPTLFHDLHANLEKIREELGESTDLVIRQFQSKGDKPIPFALVYIDGLVNSDRIGDLIMKSMLLESESYHRTTPENTFARVKTRILAIGEIKAVHDWDQLLLSILSGETAILMDGWNEAFRCATKGGEKRAVEEPSSQASVRGPRDSFTELIRTNTALVRRRIKSPRLRLETRQIGKETQTDVAIMYINGIVDEKLVAEVRQRLDQIEIDGVLESGYIEDLIRDATFSPFPTVYASERPDVIAGNLLEGRVAILVDGTPFVLVVPTILVQFFQTPEDYYQNFNLSIFLRFVRYLSFTISMLLPALYIAVTTYHQGMLPTPFLISLAAQREAIPFPAFIEALVMEVMFEVMREAGIRLPRPVGQAVSIVGAIVLGEAAVRAGLVSAAMVIVVAITAIASFTAPSYGFAIPARLLRFLFMVAGASFGLYGILLLITAVLAHLCSLRSFGVPYLSPLAPFVLADQKDTVFRVPWWSMIRRPKSIHEKPIRMADDLRPTPSKEPKDGE